MEENEMEEWVIVEYNNLGDIDDEKRSSKFLGWILETGLSLGKNAVMTGVIISSIPPFVVIAAVGCAFSLPLGFVFATYACTNQLMAKLLPIPYYPEGEEEKQMVKDGVEARIELVDDFQVNPRGQVTGEEDDDSKPPFRSETATINAEEGGVKNAESNDDVKPIHDQNLSGGKGILVVDDHEKADQEKLSLGPVGDDKEQSPQEDKQAPSADDDVVNIDSSLVEEHVVIVDDMSDIDTSKTSAGESYDQAKTVAGDGELKRDDDQMPRAVDVEHEVCVEMNDKGTVDVDVDVIFSEIAVDVFTNDEGVVVDKKIELHSVTIYSEPAGGNDNQGKAKKTVADDEVKEEIKDTRVVGDGAHSDDDEGLFGEDEDIRKKMEGIRAIVGYKGPKADSYTEELKALYVFIGIEPPPDSADFQNKLRFLMSVIGLK